jgi:hypothetical protein
MRNSILKLALAVLLSASLVLTGCVSEGGGGGGVGGPAVLTIDESGNSSFNSTVLGTTLAALPNEPLNVTEQESLIYMREEEKLAHDVYAYFDGPYGYVNVFRNISVSEATHTEAVRQLLLRYALPDPAASLVAGQFHNTTLQGLYDQLIARGSPTAVDALQVGAAIEEIDIIDIQTALINVDNQDIRLIYDNLLRGSRNHLRAFVKSLGQAGVVYGPQYLDRTEYDAIIGSPMERG